MDKYDPNFLIQTNGKKTISIIYSFHQSYYVLFCKLLTFQIHHKNIITHFARKHAALNKRLMVYHSNYQL